MTACFAVLALLFAAAPAAADDFKIIRLEQDVRNLERQVQSLMREVAELRMQRSRAGEQTRSSGRETREPSSNEWVDAAKWSRVRPGMSELEVVQTLGPPTSLRAEGEQRVMLYALEVVGGGFLSGGVTLQDGEVVEVETPRLR